MDINALRMIVTVLSFLSFVGIWVWAWRASNRARFDELSRVCIDLDLDSHPCAQSGSGSESRGGRA